jgi:hypothetical protein
MPLKLTVGISKKVGQPNYGSLGALCNVEVELDQSLIFDDPDSLQERITQAYAACRQAVQDELAAQQQATTSAPPANGGAAPHTTPKRQPDGPSNGQSGHRASQKQLDYVAQLAEQVHGLGVPRLEALVQQMFAKPLDDLTILDASGLIAWLKQIRAGKIDLGTALGGVAA